MGTTELGSGRPITAVVGLTSPMPLVTFRTPPISLSATLSETLQLAVASTVSERDKERPAGSRARSRPEIGGQRERYVRLRARFVRPMTDVCERMRVWVAVCHVGGHIPPVAPDAGDEETIRRCRPLPGCCFRGEERAVGS